MSYSSSQLSCLATLLGSHGSAQKQPRPSSCAGYLWKMKVDELYVVVVGTMYSYLLL